MDYDAFKPREDVAEFAWERWQAHDEHFEADDSYHGAFLAGWRYAMTAVVHALAAVGAVHLLVGPEQ